MNLNRLTASELRKMINWRCKHGHRGISHVNCWLREHDIEPEIGFLDIEASNLKANFGIVLSYCIKPAGSKKILHGVISKKDLKSGDMDKNLVKRCIEDMRKFDKIIGHYSSRYDIPFLRTRALIHGIDFPKYGELQQDDVWSIARRTLCLHSNRQDVLAETILGKTVKTRIKNVYWVKALQGDQESLDYILDHNMKDVIDLEKNYNKLVKYIRKSGRSI